MRLGRIVSFIVPFSPSPSQETALPSRQRSFERDTARRVRSQLRTRRARMPPAALQEGVRRALQELGSVAWGARRRQEAAEVLFGDEPHAVDSGDHPVEVGVCGAIAEVDVVDNGGHVAVDRGAGGIE